MFRKKATKRKVLSLIGVLQHVTRIVQPCRTFLSRMYVTAAKLCKLHFYTRSIRSSDQTQAGGTFSSTAGMAKVCSNAQPHRKWLQLESTVHNSPQYTSYPTPPPQWSTVHIMSKELLPIVLSCAVKGPLLARHKVLFQCDNSGVVAALQKRQYSYTPATLFMVLCGPLQCCTDVGTCCWG